MGFNPIKAIGNFVGDVFDFAFGWIYPEMPDTSSSAGTEITAASTDAFIPKIYGKVVDAKGIIVFKRTNDVDDDDIKNDLLHIIVVWAEAVQSIDEVYLNDIPVSADYMPMVDEDGNRWVYAINFPNGMDNYSDPILEQAGWSATDKLSGLACTYIRLEYNTVDDSLTSEPRISADITGTSYNNPALVLKDYLTSSVYGKGLSTSVLDLDAFTAAEQVCDQDVFLPDNVTQRKLFTCNVRIDTGNTVLDNTNVILRSMRAMMPIVDGKLRPIVEKDEVPVPRAIVEQDVEELGAITNSNKNNRYNRVIVKYYDVENRGKAQEAIYPLPDSQEAIDWLAEDNGVLLETDVDLGTCNNYYEALEFAKSYARVSREQLSTRIVLNKWGTIYEVGDIVEVTHSFPAWDAKPFRITAIQENTDTVELSLREHQPYIYDFYNTGDKPEIVDTGLDLAAPAIPTNLTVTHVYDSFKQVTVAWTGGTTRYDYQVLSSTGTVLANGRIARKTVDLQGYALGTYSFRVRAVGGIGKVSGWAQIDVIMQLPSTPTSLTINASNFDIEVIPQLTGNDGSTQFEFSITASDATAPAEVRGAASSYTFTGLTHDTAYKVWVRSVNLLGSSDWVNQVATTTADATDIEDLINLDSITTSIDTVSFDLVGLGVEVDGINATVDYLAAETNNITVSFNDLNNSVEDVELEFLRGLTQQSASREDLRIRVENDEKLIDAAVYVDPTTGTIVNRAFSYSDDLFTSASLRIDGVEGSIDLVSQSVGLVEGEIENLSAELTLVPSQITATATTIVAEAISALEPAHTFNFFDSAQGWTAVNGTISTATPNEINVTYGDIENSSLDFDAADNTFIRITIERTGGTGWNGNVIVERDNSSTETFTGIIDDVVSGGEVVRTIDFRGVTGWNGTVNRVRLTLGASTSDTFTIKSIVIGKPDAAALELEDITARVSQAELDIDSNTGEISLVATNLQTFEDDTADNFTIVSSQIDSVDSKIENRVFSINADRRDFEAQALEELRGLIDEAGYRQADINEKVSYADAINQLNVEVSDRGALAQSITALEATTVTLDTQIQTVATDLLQTESTLESAIAQSVSELQANINTANAAISANATEITRVETDLSGSISSVQTLLEARLDDNDSEISALVSDVSQAQTDISGNATAISQLQTRVTDGESFAAAQLLLNSDYEDELGTLSARAFLGTNVNDQVTGITIADSGTEQTIEFISDSVKFLDADGNVKIYYDNTESRYVFDGEIQAAAGSFTGTVTSSDGEIGGWLLSDTLLKSADTGARVELNASLNRVSVFDATDEKVAMGYLDGLPKNDGSGNWASNDYGFWARSGNSLAIDGSIDYTSGDFLVQNDASVSILDSTGNEIVRLGTDNGQKGTFVYDTTGAKIAEFSTSQILVGDDTNYLSWDSANGLSVSGNIESDSGSIGGWTLSENGLSNGTVGINSNNSILSLGANVSLSPASINFNNQLTWDDVNGLSVSGNIESDSGAIGGWILGTTLLKSADTGARIELNSDANRVSVFDATNEKVAMGYLDGLPKYDGSGNWSSNDYGFWARSGDNLVIDGDVEYNNGDFLIDNDASLCIRDGVNGYEILRVGTDAGEKGLFVYDATVENGSSANLLSKFTSDEFYVGSTGQYISWNSTDGLEVSGKITVGTKLGDETVEDLQRKITTSGNITSNGNIPNGTLDDLVDYFSGVTLATQDVNAGITILQTMPSPYGIRYVNDGSYQAARFKRDIPIVGNSQFSCAVWLAVQSTYSQQFQMRIDFKNAEGVVTQKFQTATVSTNEWRKIGFPPITAPIDAVSIQSIYLIRTSNSNTGGYGYATGLEVKYSVSGNDIVINTVGDAIENGTTLIEGGYIRTNLLDVDTILGVNATFSGELSAVTGTFGNLTTEPTGYLRTGAPETTGARVIINGADTNSNHAIWVGEGTQNVDNRVFGVLKTGEVYAKGLNVNGGTITGALNQVIGDNYMIIQRATPFGVNNLIEWYGDKTGNVDADGNAILDNLTKVNAISWKDDQGNAYTSGTIIAGTLTVSKQTSEVSATPSIETGLFGSNGGQIAINCSYFGSARDFSGGTCPTHTNPTITMRLYRLSPNGTVLVNQQSFTGEYSCLQEGAEYLATWALNGTFTFYDNLNTTSDRNYRLEATVSDLIGNPDVNQRLSILTQEA